MTDLEPNVGLAGKLISLVQSIMTAKEEAERLRLFAEFNKGIAISYERLIASEQKNVLLLEENRALKEKLRQHENWVTESKRYALHNLPNGALVYGIKKSVAGEQPPHYICANCYTNGQKTVVFFTTKPGSSSVECVYCPVCNTYQPTGFSGGCKPDYLPE